MMVIKIYLYINISLRAGTKDAKFTQCVFNPEQEDKKCNYNCGKYQMPQPLLCLMFVTDIGGEMLKATPSYFV